MTAKAAHGPRTCSKAAFAEAKKKATVEVYPADHGWCVADMPSEAGTPIYSPPDAERAWSKLLAL